MKSVDDRLAITRYPILFPAFRTLSQLLNSLFLIPQRSTTVHEPVLLRESRSGWI